MKWNHPILLRNTPALGLCVVCLVSLGITGEPSHPVPVEEETMIAADNAPIPQPPGKVPAWVRSMIRITLTVIVIVLLYWMVLMVFQRKIIYYPRPYPSEYQRVLVQPMEVVHWQSEEGRQTGFYIPPRDTSSELPRQIWFFFGGNASQALDYSEWIRNLSDPETGYFLMDYPGYGASEGRPSLKTIREAANLGFEALAKHLDIPLEELRKRSGAMGHSLGGSVGLRLALDQNLRGVVLISPFTSMVDMAKRVIGWPLCYGVLDRFDNRAWLKTLAQQSDRPAVAIIHGTQDKVVPIRMGRSLAQLFPDWIEFQEIPGADHNTLIDAGKRQISQAMRLAVVPPES